MAEIKCDGAFLEEVRNRWDFQRTIASYSFPRLLRLAEKSGILQTENKRLKDELKKAEIAAISLSWRSFN